EIAFSDRDIKIIRDSRLRECNYGQLTRHSKTEIDNIKGNHITIPFPDGQSYEQCAENMKSFLIELLKNYNNKKVMIIGARATQYGLEHWIKNVPLEEAVKAPWKWQPGWAYNLETI